MRATKKIICILLTLVLCFSLSLGTASAADSDRIFPDVPVDAEYAPILDVLFDMGVFEGDGRGYFNPDNTITRAEVTAIICRILGEEEMALSITTAPFTDVPDNIWYTGYIAMAYNLGIVEGYGSSGRFGPNDPVTYEQIVTMLIRAWGYSWRAEEEGGYPNGFLAIAEEKGVLNGTEAKIGTPALRKTVAVLVYNILQIDRFFEY